VVTAARGTWAAAVTQCVTAGGCAAAVAGNTDVTASAGGGSALPEPHDTLGEEGNGSCTGGGVATQLLTASSSDKSGSSANAMAWMTTRRRTTLPFSTAPSNAL